MNKMGSVGIVSSTRSFFIFKTGGARLSMFMALHANSVTARRKGEDGV